MTDRNPPAEKQPGHLWPLYLVISGYLILRFVWAVLVTGGGWPMSPVHYMAMAADLLLLTGVVGLRAQLVFGEADGRRTLAGVLFAAGIVSGLGLLAIRFTSDAAWWTGHLYN